ncbi:MAG: type II secretion system protein [bacterium]
MKQKGFTLIELLVVIAIIGILATVVTVSLNSARKKARDTKRLSDVKAIVTALEMYYDVNQNHYPGSTSSYGEAEAGCGGWDTSTVDNDGDGKFFIEPLQDGSFLSKVPQDPVGGSTCGGSYAYRYYLYPAGYMGCTAARGNFFILGINDLESTSGAYPSSPGWRCPENCTPDVDCQRDWQTEFEWVTGQFEQ